MRLTSQVHGLLQRTKKTFRTACERYDLVYFGHVDQHKDDHEIVRGFTLSPSHTDQHYCVGTVNGRDVILFQRADTISFPDKPSKKHNWTVLQVDLRKATMPHIILNSTHYDDTIYRQLFTKYHHLRPAAPGAVAPSGSQFNQMFKVYGEMHVIDSDTQLFINDTTAILGQHFAQFDYEYHDDNLIVYLYDSTPSIENIEHMLKAGLWLANELESSSY